MKFTCTFQRCRFVVLTWLLAFLSGCAGVTREDVERERGRADFWMAVAFVGWLAAGVPAALLFMKWKEAAELKRSR